MEKHEDNLWVLQQLAQSRALEQALYEERRMQAEALADQQATLREQRAEAEERKRDYMSDRFGGIGEEFFEKFGTDCR